MKLRLKYTEKFVSVFLLISFLSVAALVTMIVVNSRYFEKKSRFKAKLADANGLTASTPIFFKGYKIGTVKDFKLTPANYIEAELEIFNEYRDKIVENSAFWKGLNPVTNTSGLEFLQGIGSTTKLPEGAMIPAIDVPEGKVLLAEKKVVQAGDPLSILLANMQTFTETLTADTITNKGPIFKTINNIALASNDLQEIALKLNKITSALLSDHNSDQGTVFRVLNNVATLTEDLKSTNVLAKTAMLRADTLLRNYQNPDSLALRMIDPTGEKLINPMRQTILGFNALIPQLDKLTTYMNSKTSDMTILLDELRTTLHEAQATFESANKLFGNSPAGNAKFKSVSPLRPKPVE